jgi:hypothetical protein
MSELLSLDTLECMAAEASSVHPALLGNQLDLAAKEIRSLRQQLSDTKAQLATCCVLAQKSAEQAQAFAKVIDDLKGVPADYWQNERAR